MGSGQPVWHDSNSCEAITVFGGGDGTVMAGSLSAAAAELATENFFLSCSDAFLGAFFVTIVSLVSFLDGTVLSV